MSNSITMDENIVEPDAVKTDAVKPDMAKPDDNSNWNQANHKACDRKLVASDESKETPNDKTSGASFFALIRKYASVSDALRMFGALGVATAMGLFLLEGVEVANDLYRFLTMLGLTTALTAAGLLMSRLLKEQRGSRLFIGLGLLSISANFTVFGALIYSIIPQDMSLVNYPGFAHWTMSNAGEIPLALIAGVLVLLPIVWLGFTVLARSERTWLSAALILGSTFLLIPVRQELWSAIIAIAATVSVGWLVHKNHNNSLALKTPEGKFALALLFLAPVIIAVRSLFLYEATGILIVTLASGFYVCARHLLSQRTDTGFFTAVLTILASAIALIVSVSFSNVLTHHIADHWYTLIGIATLLLLTRDINIVSSHRGIASTASVILVGIATGTLMIQALLTSQVLITAASITILLGVGVYGYLHKAKTIVGIAMTGAICIIAFNMATLWSLISQTGWWGIGAAGAIAIIAGSMLDRAGTVVEVKG